MAARRREPARRGWPENVYEDGGYYSYRNPLDGKHYGLGRDRVAAFAEARSANNYVAQQRTQTSLTDRLNGDASRSLAAWVDRHDKTLEKMAEKGERSALTRRQDKHFSKVIKAWDKAKLPISRITTLDLPEFIDYYEIISSGRCCPCSVRITRLPPNNPANSTSSSSAPPLMRLPRNDPVNSTSSSSVAPPPSRVAPRPTAVAPAPPLMRLPR